MRIFLSITAALFLIGASPANGQPVRVSAEVGVPFPSGHYTPSDYDHGPQNWAVVQDDRGVVYVGNSDGILEYDGARWRLIPTTTQDSVAAGETTRSLAIGADGTLYAGTAQNFGLLEPDEGGVLQFRSLLAHVDSTVQPVRDVWNTEATREAVFFQTRDRIFRWDGDAMQVLTSETGFHTAFAVGNRFFVREFNRGLVEYVGDSLRTLAGGEQFAENSVYVMAPFPDGRILVGTSKRGFLLFDGRDWEPFETEVDGLLDRYTLYDGCALPGGHFALATLGGGAIVINAEGQLVRHLRPSRELLDGVVNAVYAGGDGSLWLALNNAGVARVNVLSPVSMFDREMGLQGTVRSVKRHRNAVYAATGMGVYVLPLGNVPALDAPPSVGPLFQRVSGVPISFDLVATRDQLLAATQRGVYRIRGDRAELYSSGMREVVFDLQASRTGSHIFAGTRSGLLILDTEAPDERRVRRVEGIDHKVSSIHEARDGSVWLGTASGVVHARFPNGLFAPPVIERYGTSDGLPSTYSSVAGIFDAVTGVAKGQVVQAVDGAAARVRFRPAPELMPGDSTDGALRSMVELASGDLLAARGNRVFRAAHPRDGQVEWASIEELHFPKGTSVSLFVDRDEVTWVAGGNRLLRYDGKLSRPVSNDFVALVRQMTTITGGTVVYGGAAPPGDTEFRIAHARSDVRFDVAAPLFNTTTPNVYQYKLDGVDTEWSEWQAEPSVVYTNLFEGTYQLHVRARNERNVISKASTFSFRVLPPWYRTVWAYAVYGLGFVLLGLAFRRYYVVMEENERQREKTKQLGRERLANERLQQANRHLRQANEMKETFLASTSHELRTPLTNILGFADLLREEASEAVHPYVGVIETNGRRLLRTLNALLDLASLRAGEMSPSLERVNVIATAHMVSAEYADAAEDAGVDLVVDAPSRPVYALLDGRYLEQILRNLIGNAIKFTDQGEVRVVVTADAKRVSLKVSDTGIGIDPAFVPDLFRDFKQESQGLARTYEGSGLGLAITARLVDLMNGTITVKSQKGEGSTFTVAFPRRQSAPRSNDRTAPDPRTDAAPSAPPSRGERERA